MNNSMWTKEDILELNPDVPVVVEGFPLVTKGKAHKYGNNVIVSATAGGKTIEGSFSWDAVIQALDDRRGIYRLPIPNHIPRPVTPSIKFIFPTWKD